MRTFVIFASILLVALCHGQSSDVCDLNQEALMKTGMECLSHDPSLMMQIIEHMEHPDDMANMKFVCSNQNDILDVSMCMEKKLVKCLPAEVQPLVSSFVDRQRLAAALNLACQHQSELLSKCMDETATAQFSTCITSKAQEMFSSLGSSMGVNGLLCRYSGIFKSCLATHSGQCPKSYISLYEEVFEMMLPEHHCDNSNAGQLKNGPASKLLGALLIHGKPMLSGPLSKMGPVYNMGHK